MLLVILVPLTTSNVCLGLVWIHMAVRHLCFFSLSEMFITTGNTGS